MYDSPTDDVTAADECVQQYRYIFSAWTDYWHNRRVIVRITHMHMYGIGCTVMKLHNGTLSGTEANMVNCTHENAHRHCMIYACMYYKSYFKMHLYIIVTLFDSVRGGRSQCLTTPPPPPPPPPPPRMSFGEVVNSQNRWKSLCAKEFVSEMCGTCIKKWGIFLPATIRHHENIFWELQNNLFAPQNGIVTSVSMNTIIIWYQMISRLLHTPITHIVSSNGLASATVHYLKNTQWWPSLLAHICRVSQTLFQNNISNTQFNGVYIHRLAQLGSAYKG